LITCCPPDTYPQRMHEQYLDAGVDLATAGSTCK
jgi:hypothetical protein